MVGQVLIDTSVWVDWLRSAETPETRSLRELLAAQRALLCDPVRMELMMFAPPLRELRLQSQLAAIEMAPAVSADFDQAAEIFRSVRRAGHTVRASVDLLIAAVAIRTGLPLLHADKDFDRIAAVIPELVIYRSQ